MYISQVSGERLQDHWSSGLFFYHFRSTDGTTLVVSSTDGYCTIVTFDEGELGKPYVETSSEQSAQSSEIRGDNTNTVKELAEENGLEQVIDLQIFLGIFFSFK